MQGALSPLSCLRSGKNKQHPHSSLTSVEQFSTNRFLIWQKAANIQFLAHELLTLNRQLNFSPSCSQSCGTKNPPLHGSLLLPRFRERKRGLMCHYQDSSHGNIQVTHQPGMQLPWQHAVCSFAMGDEQKGKNAFGWVQKLHFIWPYMMSRQETERKLKLEDDFIPSPTLMLVLKPKRYLWKAILGRCLKLNSTGKTNKKTTIFSFNAIIFFKTLL